MINKQLSFELCTDDPRAIAYAAKLGYHRVELCTGIEVGGLTPNIGLIKECTKITNIEVHVLLRHRPGDFVYNDTDLAIYMEDIKSMHSLGVKGIVTGCLHADQQLNEAFCAKLSDYANSLQLEISFHRAFDFVQDPKETMETLIKLAYKRILTSGGNKSAEEGLDNIQKYVEWASGRIEIMAGSGINTRNALKIANSGVNALHFTASKVKNKIDLGMGVTIEPDFQKIKNIPGQFHS